MDGWIKLHRKLLDWEWYLDVNTKVLFIHLLFKANFEEKKWHGITIGVGSLVTSVGTLAEESGLSVQMTRTALAHLKSTGEITIKATNKYTLITISNYGLYQGFTDDNQQANQQASQQTINKQLTSKQQATNKQSTTTKEIKEIKKEINKEQKEKEQAQLEKQKQPYGEFENVELTNDEFNKLINEYGTEKTMLAIDFLGSYKIEKPYRTKSDYLTLRRWVFKAVEEREQQRYGKSKKPQTNEDFFGGLIDFVNGE